MLREYLDHPLRLFPEQSEMAAELHGEFVPGSDVGNAVRARLTPQPLLS